MSSPLPGRPAGGRALWWQRHVVAAGIVQQTPSLNEQLVPLREIPESGTERIQIQLHTSIMVKEMITCCRGKLTLALHSICNESCSCSTFCSLSRSVVVYARIMSSI